MVIDLPGAIRLTAVDQCTEPGLKDRQRQPRASQNVFGPFVITVPDNEFSFVLRQTLTLGQCIRSVMPLPGHFTSKYGPTGGLWWYPCSACFKKDGEAFAQPTQQVAVSDCANGSSVTSTN